MWYNGPVDLIKQRIKIIMINKFVWYKDGNKWVPGTLIKFTIKGHSDLTIPVAIVHNEKLGQFLCISLEDINSLTIPPANMK